MAKFDFIIVGAGFAGATCARLLTDKGYSCLIIEERPFVGGNCACDTQNDITVHAFGPHVFHTNNEDVWYFVKDKATWLNYKHNVCFYNKKLYHLPFNLNLLNDIYVKTFPNDCISALKNDLAKENNLLNNLRDYSLHNFGSKIYDLYIKDYYKKVYDVSPENLSNTIIKDINIDWDSYTSSFYNDQFQGIPNEGYTYVIEQIIGDIPILLNTNFLSNKDKYIKLANNIIYTGEIDKLFNWCVGELHWQSIKFVIRNESEHTTSLIGMPELRFSDPTVNWYRITEHKWFTPHRQNNDIFNKNTIISYEYGDKWERGKEPFYPIINKTSQNIYKRYYDKIKQTYSNFYLCGRKAEYKNYNMAETIESAMKLCDNWDYKNL